MSSTLIATMAGGPQVVTFALDELLRRGEKVDEVIVIHLSPQADALTVQAIHRLAAEFPRHTYHGQLCRLRFFPIPLGTGLLEDICNETDADAAWSAVYGLIADLKAQRRQLHICVSGGRRILALQAMSAALLLFDHVDRLWHMYTPPDLLRRAGNGAVMHVSQEEGMRLIQVPMVPWGAYFPTLRSLSQNTPGEVLAVRRQMMDAGDRLRCQQVQGALTPRQAEVLGLFAKGLPPQEVAEQLHISLKTVDSHKSAILAQCRIAWGLPDDERLDYRFVQEHFGPFFERLRSYTPPV